MGAVNENCLSGMKCPRCGSLGPFDIVAAVTAIVEDGRVVGTNDIEWDDNSLCYCCNQEYPNPLTQKIEPCKYAGTVESYKQGGE